MAVLMVPPPDAEPWPTLGPLVVEWLEEFGVYGPGPLKGEPYRVEPEFEAQLYRMFEVYPKGHPLAGRRRFKRVGLSMRKGTAKSEKGALVAFMESHYSAPVRCDGFDAKGNPVGVCVKDPYIPMVAYTKEQSEDLAYGVLKLIIEASPLASDYDIGEERTILLSPNGGEAGKIVPLSGSPNSRDGARTTFQHFDETHRQTLPRLKQAHSTMLENIPKRRDADGWSLETTTVYEPGENSVAEDTMAYAEAVDRGEIDDPRLFFFHRHSTRAEPPETPEDVRERLLEASGPAAEWSADIDYLVSRYFEPKTDRHYYRRVWFNELVTGGRKAFDPVRWAQLADPTFVVPDGDLIVAGFDGSERQDSTGLIATHVESGYQWQLGVWERPINADDWEVDRDDVDRVVRMMHDRWQVWRVLGDPAKWRQEQAMWHGEFGTFVEFDQRSRKKMGAAVRAYRIGIDDGAVKHDGSEAFARHIGNAVRRPLGYFDEESGEELFDIRKDRADSPMKIDLAVCGVMSWEARLQALSKGVKKKRRGRVYAF